MASELCRWTNDDEAIPHTWPTATTTLGSLPLEIHSPTYNSRSRTNNKPERAESAAPPTLKRRWNRHFENGSLRENKTDERTTRQKSVPCTTPATRSPGTLQLLQRPIGRALVGANEPTHTTSQCTWGGLGLVAGGSGNGSMAAVSRAALSLAGLGLFPLVYAPLEVLGCLAKGRGQIRPLLHPTCTKEGIYSVSFHRCGANPLRSAIYASSAKN